MYFVCICCFWLRALCICSRLRHATYWRLLHNVKAVDSHADVRRFESHQHRQSWGYRPRPGLLTMWKDGKSLYILQIWVSRELPSVTSTLSSLSSLPLPPSLQALTPASHPSPSSFSDIYIHTAVLQEEKFSSMSNNWPNDWISFPRPGVMEKTQLNS